MFYTLVLACTRTSSLEVILLTAIKVLEIAKKEPLKQHLLDEIEVRDQRTNLENEHEFERSWSKPLQWIVFINRSGIPELMI